jgi:pyroglutamyl-peptidase
MTTSSTSATSWTTTETTETSKRVLVTGFEPFGGSPVNPSQEIAEALGGVVLPVSYKRAGGVLREAVRDADPAVVVCFGQAGRDVVSVERFAHNLDDGESVDNDGAVSSAVIAPHGPVAYASTLPVEEIVAALRAEGIPVKASRDAGGFLCNRVFYLLMRILEQKRPETTGGFVHVPEGMSGEEAVRAAELVLAQVRKPAAA